MAINSNKAYEVGANGFAVSDDDGNLLRYFASGVGTPNGQAGQVAPVGSIYYQTDQNLIWEKVADNDTGWVVVTNYTKITQTAHTFVLPSYGLIPVYFNNTAGEYQRANGNDKNTAADAVVVKVIDADNFIIQEDGIINVPLHGLEVGKWHVLRSGFAGLITPLDTHADEKVQYIAFALDANTIKIKLKPMFIREVDGPAISILEDWTQGAAPVISAGTNRMLQLNIHWEDSVTNGVTSASIGGVAGTLVVEQTITSGFSQGGHAFYWLESEIASFVGTAISIVWNNGTPASSVTAVALFENVNQTTPIVAINSDSGTGATDTLDADINVEADGYAFIGASGGNSAMGFTNNGTPTWNRKLDLVFASADGITDDKLITADAAPENINMGITGSNRHILITAAYRKA